MYWGTEKAKETTEATQIVTSGGICRLWLGEQREDIGISRTWKLGEKTL